MSCVVQCAISAELVSRVVQCAINAELASLVLCSDINAELVSRAVCYQCRTGVFSVVQCDIAELVCLVLCSLILVKNNSPCSQGSLKNMHV